MLLSALHLGSTLIFRNLQFSPNPYSPSESYKISLPFLYFPSLLDHHRITPAPCGLSQTIISSPFDTSLYLLLLFLLFFGGGGIYLTHLLTSGKVSQFFSPHPLTPNPHHLCRVQQTSGTCFRSHSGRKPSLL